MKGNTVLLVILTILLSCSLFFSYTNFQQMQQLRQENTSLWIKIDSVQQICSKKPIKQYSAATPRTHSTSSPVLDSFIQIGEEEAKKVAKKRVKQTIAVSSTYRLEDRYVSYKVMKPELIGDQVGEVVLNIFVDYSGDVKSAKLKSATGITNEEVIEACKKAALKTSFNFNSDLDRGTKQSGTITYIFTAE